LHRHNDQIVLFMEYKISDSYVVKEQPDGLDIYDEDGFYCELTGMTLHDFMDEEGDISDEKLIDAINEEMEAEWDDDWE